MPSGRLVMLLNGMSSRHSRMRSVMSEPIVAMTPSAQLRRNPQASADRAVLISLGGTLLLLVVLGVVRI